MTKRAGNLDKILSVFRFLASAAGLAMIAASSSAMAEEVPLPPGVWEGTAKTPKDGLPDGEYAVFTRDDQTGRVAWYGSPTSRYRHAILGDAIEAGSLHVEDSNGQRYSLTLPASEVFEDRSPRLYDLNGDGQPEVVTIRSYQDAGASVAIFGVRENKLIELASTPAIGRANRWLNIAGIADYASLGAPQIAYVETPHIGGTLRFVEWQKDKLVPVASLRGFSNHKIGSRLQNLSGDVFYNDDTLPDLAVPSNDRRTLKIVGFSNGSLTELDRIRLPAELNQVKTGTVNSGKNCVQLRLENKSLFEVCSPI